MKIKNIYLRALLKGILMFTLLFLLIFLSNYYKDGSTLIVSSKEAFEFSLIYSIFWTIFITISQKYMKKEGKWNLNEFLNNLSENKE